MTDPNVQAIKRANQSGSRYEWISCVDCGELFVRVLRGRNPYVIRCHGCRQIGHRKAMRKRMAIIRSGIVQSPGPEPMTLLDFSAEVEADVSELPVTEDRYPRGRLSPYGPVHGRSTFDVELMNSLDVLSDKAADCEWWEQNPHWHDGL